ncbi:MAG: hypothetical protein ABI321_20430 [Polyangia bacterium]
MRNLRLSLFLGAALLGTIAVPAVENVAHAQFVVIAPPEPIIEPIPVAPYEGAVWAPGYHRYHRGRYVWIGGRYQHGRPGYIWAPHRWEHEGRGWRHHPGRWQRH